MTHPPVFIFSRCRVAVLGGFLIAAPLCGWALDATDVADGTINFNQPTVAAGASGSLKISNSKKAYAQFRLDALPAGLTADNVTKATLRLFVSKVSSPGDIKVVAAGDGTALLDETLVTNDAPPTTGADIATVTIADKDALQFVSVDVTTYIKTLTLAPTSAPAFVLLQAVAGNGAKVAFDSKENIVTSHGASLQIEVADTRTVYTKTESDALYAPLSTVGNELDIPGTAFTTLGSGTTFGTTSFFGVFETAGLGYLTTSLQALPAGASITSVEFSVLHNTAGTVTVFLSRAVIGTTSEGFVGTATLTNTSAALQTITVTPSTPYKPVPPQAPLLFWLPPAVGNTEILYGAKVFYTIAP